LLLSGLWSWVRRTICRAVRFAALAAVLGLVAMAVVQDALLDPLARQWVAKWARRQLGSPDVRLQDACVGLLSPGVRVDGLRIADPGRPDRTVLSLESVVVTWRWTSLLGDGPIELSAAAEGGVLHFYRRKDGTYSFQRPDRPRTHPTTSRPHRPRVRRAKRRLLCRFLRLRDVAITFEDFKRPLAGAFPPLRLAEFAAHDLAFPMTAHDPVGRYELHVGIDHIPDAELHASGTVVLLGHLPEVAFRVEAQRVPLTVLNTLFLRKLPFLAETGWADFRARAAYHNERVHSGTAELWLMQIDHVRLNPVYAPDVAGVINPDLLVARLNTASNWYLPMKFSRRIHRLKWRPRWLELRPVTVAPDSTGR
jgi:hypothetical protein